MGQLGDHQKEKYPEQERHPFPEPAARVHTLNPFRDSLWSRAGPMCSATKGVSGSLFGKIYSGTPLSSGGEESLAKQKKHANTFAFACFAVVARLGFEPRQTESESVVLPLHNRASSTDSFIIIASPGRIVKGFPQFFSVLRHRPPSARI